MWKHERLTTIKLIGCHGPQTLSPGNGRLLINVVPKVVLKFSLNCTDVQAQYNLIMKMSFSLDIIHFKMLINQEIMWLFYVLLDKNDVISS